MPSILKLTTVENVLDMLLRERNIFSALCDPIIHGVNHSGLSGNVSLIVIIYDTSACAFNSTHM